MRTRAAAQAAWLRRNDSIASTLAHGALRCGQWPTLLMTCSSLRGITECM